MEQQLDLFKDVLAEVTKITKRKKKSQGSVAAKKEFDLLEFKRVLNQEPPKKLIKVNREFGNKFIPLQVVEQMLNAMYDAYEVVIPFAPTYIEGQVITTVNITVHHPVLKIPLTYSGISCVPIIAAENTNMKWNHRNIPGGKGFAIINASKEIGQIFRAEKDDHSDIMRDYFEKKKEVVTKEDEEAIELKKRLLNFFKTVKTLESLKKQSKKVIALRDKEVYNAYKSKEEELTNNK